MPIRTCDHRLAFNENYEVVTFICAFKNSKVSMKVIEGDIECALHLPDLHASEQYFTDSQSRAHFLRHSKGRPQVSQSFGGCPFLIRGRDGIRAHRPQSLRANDSHARDTSSTVRPRPWS